MKTLQCNLEYINCFTKHVTLKSSYDKFSDDRQTLKENLK